MGRRNSIIYLMSNIFVSPRIIHLIDKDKICNTIQTVAKLNGLNQDNPEVVSHIKRRLLIPPPANPPKQPQRDHSKGHSEKILNHFKNMVSIFYRRKTRQWGQIYSIMLKDWWILCGVRCYGWHVSVQHFTAGSQVRLDRASDWGRSLQLPTAFNKEAKCLDSTNLP